MTHFGDDQFAALADGQAPTATEAAHLAGCPLCRSELKALRSLVGDLSEAPAPPPALRQATLRRLGLAPRPRTVPRVWFWGPALAAGLSLLVVLAIPGFRAGNLPAPAPTAVPTQSAQASQPVSFAKENQVAPRRALKTAPALAPVPVSAAGPVLASAADAPSAAPASATLAQPVQAQAPPALGADAAPRPLSGGAVVVVQGPPSFGMKASPTPLALALRIVSVRNNLLKPNLGQYLSFTVDLPRVEAVKAMVLDSNGRTVAVLYDGAAGPEPLDLRWDGAEASGAYTILVHSPDSSARLHVLVLR